MSEIISLYTDGGIIGRNPSSIGGVYAWCGVDSTNIRIIEKSGVVLATENRKITNNHTEQMAIVLALEAMINNWSGTLYSDSRIALGRVFLGWRNNNLPNNVIERTRNVIMKMGNIRPILLQGHPTQEDLQNGFGKKRGLPVSEHNVFCDEECARQKELYFKILQELELEEHRRLLSKEEVMNDTLNQIRRSGY